MVITDGEVTKSDDIASEKDEFSLAVVKTINRIIKNEEYVTYTMCKRNISTGGGNYLSLLYEVDIKGKTKKCDKETNLFVKAVLTEQNNDLVHFETIFHKEIFVYTDLANTFDVLQDEANIPVEERYIFAKCYSDINDSDALILENLTKRGFKTYHRMDIIQLRVMERCIQHLAKFHGVAIALKIKRPDLFKSKYENLKFTFEENETTTGFLRDMFKINLDYIDEDKKKRVEDFLPVFLDKYFQYYLNNEHKFKCLCHADYRINNILVKEVEGEIKELIPVDYQFVYNGSPVIDLIYFIFISTDPQFRKNHMDDLKNIYYDSLRKFLGYFDLDLDSIYLKKDFENDFKERLDYGLMVTFIVLSLLYVDEDDVPDIVNGVKQFILHHQFRGRLNATIAEFIERGSL